MVADDAGNYTIPDIPCTTHTVHNSFTFERSFEEKTRLDIKTNILYKEKPFSDKTNDANTSSI